MIGLSVVNSESKSQIRQPVGVFGARLKLEQVDDINESDPQIGELLPEKNGCGQCLLCRYITGAKP